MDKWKTYELKQLVKLSKIKYNPKKESLNLPCIELEHIQSGTGRLIGKTNSIEQASIKNRFKPGDVLYGKLRPYLRKYYFADFEGVCSSEIWVFQNVNERIHNKYLYYLIQTDKFNYNANKSIGTKMPRADWNYISEITFRIPSLEEQKKIASILSTWDKAIELKEKLIELKKEQQKGLMQKLLTGEVRLPGFEGKWDQISFDEIFKKLSVKKYQIKTNEYLQSGKYPVVDQGQKKVAAFSNDIEKVLEVPETGVIVFGDHTREIKFIDFNFVVGADGTQVLITKDNYNLKFYYYHLLIQKIPNTGYNRHFKFLKEMKFYKPSLKEQKEISKLLCMFDKEITLLEQELDLLKQQKKGLMQLLLTGKVRVKV